MISNPFIPARSKRPLFTMVSVDDSHSNQLPSTQNLCTSSRIQRPVGRSMRTIRSNLFQNDHSCSFHSQIAGDSGRFSENLTESVVDFRLRELALVNNNKSLKPTSDSEFLDLSQAFSDFSACSSDISGELQRLACFPASENDLQNNEASNLEIDADPWFGFLQRENHHSADILESISTENLEQAVQICIEGLHSESVALKRSSAEKLRLLAKNRSENRALIGESSAIPALVPLLRCADPWTQEHAVTALLNLSLHEGNKTLITDSGAIKPLVYVLKTGTEASKQNAACALLSLSLIDDNKISIGVCGAIPPLVSLLLNGSNRGKKDALTTLYKLCSMKQNKEKAVNAGAVKPLLEFVSEQRSGLAEKAMVVLSSLAGVEEGKTAIVEEGGIPVLVEAIEYGSVKRKEFAVVTLLQLCTDSAKNRGLLVREGVIPPLVALSQSGTARAKEKV
ncbi:Armadillo [Macleaya cordata]|uniref:RING-type E3 ubiquitin transferase n=1 Tax=Macleaya cordata TaxID=56857 RepID=A0A200Q045_MACCD|nr:Armadillo [Macleaya cordata]